MLKILKPILLFTVYLFIGMCCLFVPEHVHALPSNQIIGASSHVSSQTETIEVQTVNKPQFYVLKLDHPKRIVFTIRDSFFRGIHYSEPIPGKKATGLRLSQNTRNQARLVIDLAEDTNYRTNIEKLTNDRYLLKIDIPAEKKLSIHPVLITRLEAFQAPASAVSGSPVEKRIFQHIIPSPLLEISSDPQTGKVLSSQSHDKTLVMLESSVFDDPVFDETSDLDAIKKPLNFSGLIQTRSSADSDHDRANENKTSVKNRSILKADYKNRLTLSVLSDYLYFGSPNQTDDYTIDLYEAYARYRSSFLDISIGKQIKRWGKTDQISPVDTLNPENLTEFIIPSYDERKIPVWMADLVFKKNDFFIEGVFIPFFEPSKFDYFGTDWAIFSHLKEDIIDSSLPSFLKSYFNAIDGNETQPDNGPDSFEYAMRMGGTIQQLDFAFTYHCAIEDLPYFDNFPVKNISVENSSSIQNLISNPGGIILTDEKIQTSYLKTHNIGFEFETIVSDLGFRGEAAWKDKESFLTQSFTSVRNQTLFWILGADYTSSDNWYINLQFGHQHIADYDDSILFFDKDNYYVIGEINKDLISDWLNASVQYTLILNDNSYYVSPRLAYTYIKNLELTLGVNFFEGPQNSIFGRYDENDQVFVDLTYYF